MEILYIIPARGGSKGIPHKNIKELNGRPLIYYSIDVARALASDENICVSTDDDSIIKIVQEYGLEVPFKRPDSLATDVATTNDVLLHALDYYEKKGKRFDTIVLLQPTSPLREACQVKEAVEMYSSDLDMVVSVKESHSAAVLCKENRSGFLELCLNQSGVRRQDISSYFEYNGAIYVINVRCLKNKSLNGLTEIKKYVMDEKSSVDIDTVDDWFIAESFLKNKRS